MSDLLKRIGIGVGIGLVVGLLVSWSTQTIPFLKTMLDGYEYRSYDSRMKAKVAGVEEASIEDVVIIDIDQISIDALGSFRDWPHAYHGQLIDVVTSGNPKALLFDVIFDPEDSYNFELVSALLNNIPPENEDLYEATEQYLISHDPERFISSTAQSDRVYHGLVFEQSDSLNFAYVMASEPEGYNPVRHILHLPNDQAIQLPNAERLGNTHLALLDVAKGAGSINFPQDEDGISRRAPTAIYFEGPQHAYPSLSMAAVRDILDIPQDGFEYDFDEHLLRLRNRAGEIVRKIPIDDEGRMYVNYYGYAKTFYYLPYSYCFDPEMLPPEYWEGKVAIVGSSLPALFDLRNTPVQETFVGSEIHASIIHSILKNEFVKVTDSQTNLMAILLISVLLGIIVGIPPKPLWSVPFPLIGIVGWIIFSYSQFLGQLIMWEIVRPAITIGLTYLGIFLYNFFIAEKDKRFLKNTFGTYISPELIDQMYKNKEEPKLGGDEGYLTAYFTDIQSFSAFSEKLTASDLVELLNEYLTEMTNILIDNKGTLDKYIGDAIVAFYGAPAPVEQHEYYACLTAVKMQQGLTELREKWASEGDRWPVIVHHMQNRIGINSGPLVTGNMGSTTRMSYTMMGDTVNLAARLEASAKQYGVYIQVAEGTYKACKEKFVWRNLDYVRVMGKTEPARVFELICEAGTLTSEQEKYLKAFHEAQDLYNAQKWDKAVEAFKAADEVEDMFPGRKTNPSRVYIPRCEHWKANPPGDNWDGVWTLTKK